MLDFPALGSKEKTINDLCDNLTPADLAAEAHEMIDTVLDLIADCRDEDVIFVPDDPKANDTYAADDSDVNLAWTLGHVIVHLNASSEESAFLAAEMARGVARSGRSRYEIPWQEVTSITQCRDLLEASRRMLLATLDTWPNPPHYEITSSVSYVTGTIDARGRFVLGLGHAFSHLGQIKEIVRQARAARAAA
jgi:hypothetical protein